MWHWADEVDVHLHRLAFASCPHPFHHVLASVDHPNPVDRRKTEVDPSQCTRERLESLPHSEYSRTEERVRWEYARLKWKAKWKENRNWRTAGVKSRLNGRISPETEWSKPKRAIIVGNKLLNTMSLCQCLWSLLIVEMSWKGSCSDSLDTIFSPIESFCLTVHPGKLPPTPAKMPRLTVGSRSTNLSAHQQPEFCAKSDGFQRKISPG